MYLFKQCNLCYQDIIFKRASWSGIVNCIKLVRVTEDLTIYSVRRYFKNFFALFQIPAIHDFGLFMFLLVSCCWLAIVLLIPPSLYLWSISCSHCEVFTFRWWGSFHRFQKIKKQCVYFLPFASGPNCKI